MMTALMIKAVIYLQILEISMPCLPSTNPQNAQNTSCCGVLLFGLQQVQKHSYNNPVEIDTLCVSRKIQKDIITATLETRIDRKKERCKVHMLSGGVSAKKKNEPTAHDQKNTINEHNVTKSTLYHQYYYQLNTTRSTKDEKTDEKQPKTT